MLNSSVYSLVLLLQLVVKGKNIIGVEFMRNMTRQRVKVTQEVILSAGVVGSPHILQLSGIGPRKLLEQHKVRLTKNVQ